jgi:UPF0042 nucleotide-binding protein
VSPRPAAAARTAGAAGAHPFIVLTGLSGAGKSQAIRALEDLGYFCVDNLPTTLIPTLATLVTRGGEIEKVAIVVDVREGSFLSSFPKVLTRLRKTRGLNPVLIFLEASDAALQRRFSETRRPHPLAPDRSAAEGIRDERVRLRRIREMADEIVDTSDLTVHELRRFFMTLMRDRAQGSLVVTLLSFGYKYGLPMDADLVFDVRCLPNPHFVPALRPKTGLDEAVSSFVLGMPEASELVADLTALLTKLIPRYAREGKSYLTIAVGCTGGRHRSVAIAEALGDALRAEADIRVEHRDLAMEPLAAASLEPPAKGS